MSEEQKQEFVHKVTLFSGKVVFLRDIKIKHHDLAMRAVGDRAGDNKMLMAQLTQKELLKILIHSIDGKQIPVVQLENMDDHFTLAEYTQLQIALDKLSGGADLGNFQTEIVAVGRQ